MAVSSSSAGTKPSYLARITPSSSTMKVQGFAGQAPLGQNGGDSGGGEAWCPDLGGVVVNLDVDEVHAVGVFVFESLEDVHLRAAGGGAAVGGGGEGYEQGFGFVQGVGYGEAVEVRGRDWGLW